MRTHPLLIASLLVGPAADGCGSDDTTSAPAAGGYAGTSEAGASGGSTSDGGAGGATTGGSGGAQTAGTGGTTSAGGAGGSAGPGGTAGSAGTAGSGGSAPWWTPAPELTWQWNLSDAVPPTHHGVDVYDVDLFEVDAAFVAALHAQGRKAICYMSAGSWEDWRPDKDDFPSSVLGNDYDGWPGEKWLDIRAIDDLAPVMRARMDLCKSKGFDGVEPDNIDAFENDTGFPLTAADQIAYNRWLAAEAHARGLSIGLKNDSGQVADLVDDFDWALTEDCFAQGWCSDMSPFITRNKAVFMCEYTDTGIQFADACAEASTLRFSAILKHRDLGDWMQNCDEPLLDTPAPLP